MSAPGRGRRIALILGAFAVAGAGLAAGSVVAVRMAGTTAAETLGRGDYRLETTDGAGFTEDRLRGAPSAVFFGFAHCPEVCPTTLAEVADWQAGLAGDGRALRVFFVTVDPERDTVAMLGDYVSWVPGVVGVSGARAEIDKAIRAFRIYAAKVPLEGGGYTMDHTAHILLFDARGRMAGVLPYQTDPAKALEAIRALYTG